MRVIYEIEETVYHVCFLTRSLQNSPFIFNSAYIMAMMVLQGTVSGDRFNLFRHEG
jgi:hypothetical protein